MKPAAFDYHRPASVDEALGMLKEYGDGAKILAGGQSLMPMMNFRLAQPAHLIDINFIPGFNTIRSDDGALKIGCLARQAEVLDEPLVRDKCSLLADALAHVGYSQTRNRGTLCGSLAHADPAAELPAVLLALNGSLTVRGSGGQRVIAAEDFFHSFLSTALTQDELLLEASIPEQPARAGSSFIEFARRFGDFAIVGVATVLVADGDAIGEARIALSGAGDKPWRERRCEEMLIGKKATPELFSTAARAVAAAIAPHSDLHASSAYRRSLANVLTRRALTQAWQKARSGN